MQNKQRVTILGAGPAGTVIAILLARRGLSVRIFEMRDDIRTADRSEGWSHSVILSQRGLTALANVGLADRIAERSARVVGRTMHGADGTVTTQPYGREGEFMLVVRRHELVCMLLDAAEAEENVELCFAHRFEDVDLDQNIARFVHAGESVEVEADLIIAADGARSLARTRMLDVPRFNYSQVYQPMGYKEVVVPAGADGTGAFDGQHLHIWPRNAFTLICVPGHDHTTACALFLPFDGENSFAELDTGERLHAFLSEQFADAYPVLAPVTEQLLGIAARPLFTIHCDPFHHNRTLLIGDAAHAIVPFFGQGLNCALEDCTVLARVVDKCGNDWEKVLATYSRKRKPDTDAIAEIALENFHELSTLVAKKSYLWRQKLERTLHRMMPDHFIPMHVMVNFSDTPYAEVQRRAKRQEAWLLEVLTG